MAAALLSTASVLLCVHGGQGRAVSVSPRVRVAGSPVLLSGAPATVAGCTNPPPPPGPGAGPCVTAQFTTAALRVRVQGVPVLLQNSSSVCSPTGTPLLASAAQTGTRGV
jgi:uncharacterized Zn-binding protein involved in type VI secretion